MSARANPPGDVDRLFDLLPVIYRLRDRDNGGALRTLLAVMADQLAVLEEDIDQLYDDLFIETAADWVVPYIGDLIGYRLPHDLGIADDAQVNQDTIRINRPRAEVANTIRYRRRKGTASMLEQLARDVTGWEAARVVEFFALLATTQYLNHLRPENRSWADLRRTEALARIDTPFEEVAHTLDVRRISSRRGRFNIPNIGIFLWRLHAYPVIGGTARRLAAGRYSFHPLGLDAPLFNVPRTEQSMTQLAAPVNVPEPLRRRPLYAELESRRQAQIDGATPTFPPTWFADRPALRVFVDTTEIVPERILICDLSDWRTPPDTIAYRPGGKARDDALPDPTLPIEVAVDPVLGRLAFPSGNLPANGTTVRVNYAYGFPDDLGGGPYARTDIPEPTFEVTTAAELIAALAALPNGGDRVIQIASSTTLTGNLTIPLDPGQRVTIQAADGQRPVIDGSITITAAEDSRVTLDGLLISGQVVVTGSQSLSLILRDTTLYPATHPSLQWPAAGVGRLLVLDRAIAGRVRTGDGVRLDVRDSVIDAQADDAYALAASDDGAQEADRLVIVRSTVVGAIHVRELDLAEESIFTGPLTSDRRQQGCVRFCYLPRESRTPRQYRCQPERAVRDAVDAAKRENRSLSNAEQAAIAARIMPGFTARDYGQPAYLQLSLDTPAEIRNGAEDGGEMGVYHDLFQSLRELNLQSRLDEYLRAGLEAGVFYAT